MLVASEQLISFSSSLIMRFLSIMGPSSLVNAEIITSQMSVKCWMPILIPQRGLSRAGSPSEGCLGWNQLLACSLVKINSRGGWLGRASSPGNGLPWIPCPERSLPVPSWVHPSGFREKPRRAVLGRRKGWAEANPAGLCLSKAGVFLCVFSINTDNFHGQCFEVEKV